MANANMTLTQAIQAYLDYLAHEQGASRTTRAGYQSGLRRFFRFLTDRRGEEPRLCEVNTDDVRSYLYSLSRQGLRPRSLRGAIYPIRGLFGMAVSRGWLLEDPSRAVKLPRKDAAVRETVSDEELTQLLAGCERDPDPVRRTMRKAVLALLIYAGLRRQELLDLQVADLDLKERKLLVRSGKGGKSRSLYLCQEGLTAVRAWLAVRPTVKHPYLFITDIRRRLGEEGLRQLIEETKSLADLRGHENIKPHSIRHAAATRLLRNGADLRSIQQFLGHSQLQTTAIYLHTDERQLQRISELADFQNTQAEVPERRQGRAGGRGARVTRSPERRPHRFRRRQP